jgi:hypothetical protein
VEGRRERGGESRGGDMCCCGEVGRGESERERERMWDVMDRMG